MACPSSSTVASGDLATSCQYNNLRCDAITHTHCGNVGSATVAATTFSGCGAKYTGGIWFVGCECANGNMTTGVTVQQACADNQAIALKSSDVATGLTTAPLGNVETDDYFTVSKISATRGGAHIQALAEDSCSGQEALLVEALGGLASTCASTTAASMVRIRTAEHNGCNVLCSASANKLLFGIQRLVCVACTPTWHNAFLVDAEGDLHVDGSACLSTFDHHCDVSVARAIRGSLYRRCHPCRAKLEEHVTANRDLLASEGIISYNDCEDGVPFIAMKRMNYFLLDAIAQLGDRIKALEDKVG